MWIQSLTKEYVERIPPDHAAADSRECKQSMVTPWIFQTLLMGVDPEILLFQTDFFVPFSKGTGNEVLGITLPTGPGGDHCLQTLRVQKFAPRRVKGEPFSKGLPSGSNVGCLPLANASKDHWRLFQISSQVSFLPQDLGKQARSQWLNNVLRPLSKQPQLKTRRLSLLEYSTPSPCIYKGMVRSSQSFSKDMGWPFNFKSPVLATLFQKLAKLPFPKQNN